MTHNILIVGNGFDLYHHLPTRYSDFMFFASEWETFYSSYQDSEVFQETGEQIEVPLTENGELIQESLEEFGRHKGLFDDEHVKFLNQNLQSNSWIQYFSQLENQGLKWIDFEAEIQKALYDTEEYSMNIIPKYVGKVVDEDIPDRIRKIQDCFCGKATNGYINFGQVNVLKDYVDVRELQLNKEKLIEFMLSELNILIACLNLYLADFVENMKCKYYSEQIRPLQGIDLLNFNYTTTYHAIYGKQNLHEHHAVHGGITNKDIVLGISDNAFPDTYDYVHFQKYFQRIQKQTGSFYRKWLRIGMTSNGGAIYNHVYIMGHSLGIADFGVLKAFFEDNSISKVTIYYHNQNSYENLVINLVKAFGKERVIEMIGEEKIVFEKLKEAMMK